MTRDSQIVIGPDGKVVAVAGDLPSGLVDRTVNDCESLSHEIRGIASALVLDLRASENRVAAQTVPREGGRPPLQLVAIDALAVSRLFKPDGLNAEGARLAMLLLSDICVAQGDSVLTPEQRSWILDEFF